MKKDLYIMHCEMLGRAFIHNRRCELEHSGTKGMKWGYNYGKRNGKRIAKGPEELLNYFKIKDSEDPIKLIEEIQRYGGKRPDDITYYYFDSDGNRVEFDPYAKPLPNEIMERSGVLSPYAPGELEAVKNFKPEIPGWTPVKKKREWTKDEDQAVINQIQDWYNCALCTYAYDLRRRGYDVVARSFISDAPGGAPVFYPEDKWKVTTNNQFLLGYKGAKETWYDGDVKLGSNPAYYSKKDKTSEELRPYAEKWIKDMEAIGDGNRGALLVNWTVGTAHSMAYEVNNGKLIIRDCQMNTTPDFIDDILPRIENFSYIRLDNLEPDFDYLSNFVEDRK